MVRKKTFIELEFTDESTLQLRGRQSVRTTFKLSRRSIRALSILALQMGIKQKTLFDHLVDDIQALKTIANEMDSFPDGENRVAKTYVISRSTLESLEQVASRYNTPRDILVEYSIERILPLIEREKKRHSKRTEIVQRLGKQIQQIEQLFQEAEQTLGLDDPLVEELSGIVRNNEGGYNRIYAFWDKSRKIEDF